MTISIDHLRHLVANAGWIDEHNRVGVLRKLVLETLSDAERGLDNLGDATLRGHLRRFIAAMDEAPEVRKDLSEGGNLSWKLISAQGHTLLYEWAAAKPSKNLALFCGIQDKSSQRGAKWVTAYEGSCSVCMAGGDWWSVVGSGSCIKVRAVSKGLRLLGLQDALVAASGMRRAAELCPELLPMLAVVDHAIRSIGLEPLPLNTINTRVAEIDIA